MHFRLAAEAHRIRLAYQYDPHFAVSVSQIDPLPHQLDAVYGRLLTQPRIRLLIADDPGAGKTIMGGLLIKELKLRGLIERTLIVTPATRRTSLRSVVVLGAIRLALSLGPSGIGMARGAEKALASRLRHD